VLGQFGGGDSFAFGSGTRRLSVAGADVFCEKKERKKKRRKKEKKKKRKAEKQRGDGDGVAHSAGSQGASSTSVGMFVRGNTATVCCGRVSGGPGPGSSRSGSG
jgi:hypothetical protein